MIGSFQNKALRLCVAFVVLIGSTAFSANAQSTATPPKPYLPPIVVQGQNPVPSSTPLIKKTGSVAPTSADIINPADILIPGYTGILVETLDKKVVKENSANFTFNPASNVKVATTYAVLKSFGPEYRFPTNVFTDGEIDKTTGTLNGNLYISGRDMSFSLENGVAIADALNRLGVRTITGDLVVTYSFIMGLSGSAQVSGNILATTLDSGKRSSGASRAWQNFIASKPELKASAFPGVTVSGRTYVDVVPTNAKLLFTHESTPLKEILKLMMCFSNNFLAEKLGDMVGGPYMVARYVQTHTGVSPEEFILQTSSGLGINRVTPRAMMRLLHTLRSELARHKMTFADVMPVAGVDPGTLQRRLNSPTSVGSVVGKTGTLGNTDGGASALCGEMQTRQGKMLFVIFSQRGNNQRFRSFQDSYVTSIQNQFGGAAPLGYASPAMAYRMSKTRITFPTMRASGTE